MTRPEFQQLQLRFARALRDPAAAELPELEARRLAVYQTLFYNNVEGFIARAFPVLRALSDDAAWHARVRDFFARYRCQDPCFHGIAEAFVDYLSTVHVAGVGDPPFLAELAHYEWVELALSIAEDPPADAGLEPEGDLLEGAPVLSPLAWLLVYAWPVHQIGPDARPHAAPDQATYLCAYRDREDEVRFMVLNAVSARLLQLMEAAEGHSGRVLLQSLAEELQHPDPRRILDEGLALLLEFRARGIVLGTRRPRHVLTEL